MKTLIIMFMFAMIIATTAYAVSSDTTKQYKQELGFFCGSGYMTDNSGSGGYSYFCPGLMFKKDNYRRGIFANLTKVYVNFNGYDFKATEITLGPQYDKWGHLSGAYSYSFWFQPGLKYFSDYGHDANMQERAWQKDFGFYGVSGFNFSDSLNRWFRSYNFSVQYQKPFWSQKTGTWEGGGNISDKVNFKATNKTYFCCQFEVTVRKLHLKKGRVEPKLIANYLYDGGSQKDLFSFGPGIAVSFQRGHRYFQVFSLQYRARYGIEFNKRLDLFEINCDFINLYKLVKN